MNRRADWHPSYGTPMPDKYRDRVAGVRDRLGIDQPEPNLKVRAWVGVMFLCGALAAIDVWPVGFSLVGCAVWVMWPILTREDW